MQVDMSAASAERVASNEPLLKIRELDKHFGPVQALYHVDLDIPSGQVTALCGDNGAGKTVLTKCIAGVYQADHGQVTWEGHPVHIRNARDAARLGIATVYQDLALADNLDIVRLVVQAKASTFDRQSVVEYMTTGGLGRTGGRRTQES